MIRAAAFSCRHRHWRPGHRFGARRVPPRAAVRPALACLAMANAGPGTNGSAVRFITVAPTPWLNFKHRSSAAVTDPGRPRRRRRDRRRATGAMDRRRDAVVIESITVECRRLIQIVSVPVCYRHPTARPTSAAPGASGPICRTALTSAAVGFQCPSCVAEGRASTLDVVSVLAPSPPSVARGDDPSVSTCWPTSSRLTSGTSLLTGLDNISTDYGMAPCTIAVEDQFPGSSPRRSCTPASGHIGFQHAGPLDARGPSSSRS